MTACPKCEEAELSPTLLAAGLSARACGSCEGALVDLLAYRAWSDQAGIDGAQASDSVEIDDTRQAISCPNCSAVMTKFRLAAAADNRLDFCAHCDAAWLDGGEWQQLENLGLRRQLGSVFTQPWQRRIREEISGQSREEVLRQRFGQDYDRIAEIRDWVQRHPQYEYILAWLGDNPRD